MFEQLPEIKECLRHWEEGDYLAAAFSLGMARAKYVHHHARIMDLWHELTEEAGE